MTVPSTARRAGPFLGNGVTTSFPFTFKTFAAADLQVIRTSTIGVESVLVLSSDYSVALNLDQDTSPGGTITYPISGVALATGEKLTVIGDLEYEQTTDLLGGGAFNAKVIEDTFDRTVIQVQQLLELIDRCVTVPVSSGASAALPTPEALQVLAWNAAGDALTNLDVTDFLTVAGSSGFSTQTFSGTGAQTAFTLTQNPGAIANLEVFISGVRKAPGGDYTVSGTTLTFSSAPPAGSSNILVRWGTTLGIGVPAEGAVVIQSGTTQVLPAAPVAPTVESTIPAWAKRVKLQLFGVSTNGSSRLLVQLGTPSAWVATGYASCAMYNSSVSGAFSASATTGFLLEPANAASDTAARAGIVTLEVADGTHWVMTSQFYQGTAVFVVSAAGTVQASGITRVRLVAENGTDTFDAGRVGITFE